jgi:uncharacterized membrane protein YbhN (UPF0104 family)
VSSTPSPSAEGRTGRSRRQLVLTALKWFVGAVAVVILVVETIAQRQEIAAALHRITPGAAVAAALATLAALAVNMLSWRAAMHAVGAPLRLRAAAGVFFLGQLGKYIPGGVWSIAAQSELARSEGVPRAQSAVASVASMFIGMVSAAVVGIAGLLVGSADGLRTFWWLALLALVGLMLLAPPILTRIVRVLFRLLRRPDTAFSLSWGGTVAALVWSVVMWLLYGVQASLLLHAFDSTRGGGYALATGAYAIAWLVGFLVILAPAGLGAREATLLLLLGAVTSASAALGLAVLSRAMMTLGDALFAALGAALGLAARRRRRSGLGAAVAPGVEQHQHP